MFYPVMAGWASEPLSLAACDFQKKEQDGGIKFHTQDMETVVHKRVGDVTVAIFLFYTHSLGTS